MVSKSRIFSKLSGQPLPAVINPRAADTTAPTAPGVPVISNITADGATITVSASTDAVGVVGYAAFLDGSTTPTATSPTTSMQLAELLPGEHSVVVKSFDEVYNYSLSSVSVNFTIDDLENLLNITLSLTDWRANTRKLQSAINIADVSITNPGIYPIKGGTHLQGIISIPSNRTLSLGNGVIIDNLGDATGNITDGLGRTVGYPKTAFINKNSTSNAITVSSVTHAQGTPTWWTTVTVNIGSNANPFSVGEYIYIRPAYSGGDTTGFYNWIYRVTAINNSDPLNRKISYETPSFFEGRIPAPTGGLIVYQADANVRVIGPGKIRMMGEDPRLSSSNFLRLGYIQVVLNKIINGYCSVVTTGSRGTTSCTLGNTFNSTISMSVAESGATGVQIYGPSKGSTILSCAGESKDDLVAIFTDGSTTTAGVQTGFFDADNVTNNTAGDVLGTVVDFQGKVHRNAASRSVLLVSNNGHTIADIKIKNLRAENFTYSPIEISNVVAGGASLFGNILLEDCDFFPRTGAKIILVASYNQQATFKKIILNRVNVPWGSTDGNLGLCNTSAGAEGMFLKFPLSTQPITVEEITLDNCFVNFDHSALTVNNQYGIFLEGNTTVETLNITGGEFKSVGGTNKSLNALMVNNQPGGIKNINIDRAASGCANGYFVNYSRLATVATNLKIDRMKFLNAAQPGAIAGCPTLSYVSVTNTDYNLVTTGLIDASDVDARTLNIYISNVYGNGRRILFQIGTNHIYNIRSGGGNNAGWWAFGGAGNVFNFIDNCEDMYGDVTGIARVNGTRFNNTNAAAGTINAAGPVFCQGTANLSWKRFISAAGGVSAQEY